MALHMLTTSDNPFNPTENFDEWMAYDERAGYYTMSYLARIAKTSPDLSDADNDLAIELAIDEIVEMNILGIYQKVEVPEAPNYPEDPALSMLKM